MGPKKTETENGRGPAFAPNLQLPCQASAHLDQNSKPLTFTLQSLDFLNVENDTH